MLSVTLAGSASPGVDHLWVTVAGVAMNADAAAVYGDGSSGWVVETLAAPVTVEGLVKPFPTALSSVATPIVPVLDARRRRVGWNSFASPAPG